MCKAAQDFTNKLCSKVTFYVFDVCKGGVWVDFNA